MMPPVTLVYYTTGRTTTVLLVTNVSSGLLCTTTVVRRGYGANAVVEAAGGEPFHFLLVAFWRFPQFGSPLSPPSLGLPRMDVRVVSRSCHTSLQSLLFLPQLR